MAQFYFLSILMNLLTGLILVYGEKRAGEDSGTGLSVADSGGAFDDFGDPFADDGEAPAPAADSFGDTDAASQLAGQEAGILNSPVFRLVIGILGVFVGIMKLLSVFRNDVPVVGDLLPAIAGCAGGAALLIEYFISSTTQALSLPPLVETVFVDSRKYVGVLCLVAAVLHFIFPQVLFL